MKMTSRRKFSAITITIALSLISTFASAYSPRVQFGVRLSHYDILEGGYLPGNFNLDIRWEPYFGVSGELLINPLKNLSLRLELAQLRFYTRHQLGGGQSLHLFNNLDADVIYVLPVGKKVSPLIYGGVNLEKYYNKPLEDWRAFGADYDIRLGPGVLWRAKKNIDVFGEVELLKWAQMHRHAIYTDAPEAFGYFLFGFPKVSVGVRYTL